MLPQNIVFFFFHSIICPCVYKISRTILYGLESRRLQLTIIIIFFEDGEKRIKLKVFPAFIPC